MSEEKKAKKYKLWLMGISIVHDSLDEAEKSFNDAVWCPYDFKQIIDENGDLVLGKPQ